MPTLYVSWYGGVQHGIAKEPLSTSVVTTSGTSAKTAVAPAGASLAIVEGDAAHYVNVGPEPSVTAASTNGGYVGSGKERPIAINPGDAVAAITV
jgi:hypothetical protein